MKFTNGYWNIKDGIRPLYAVEYFGHEILKNTLRVYVSTKHIYDRSSCVEVPLLTFTFSSPMENVIKISQCHHNMNEINEPAIFVWDEEPSTVIEESGDELVFITGDAKAVIDKRANNWSITFYNEKRYLTQTGWRNTAYMTETIDNSHYMVEQLAVDIDEYVYGLGERFTPFVKNGQSVRIWNEDGGTASEMAYKNIPFYMTNRSYGVLVDDLGDVEFEINSEKVERIQFSVGGEKLSYYIIAGEDPFGVVSKYTDLTGKPTLPPAWSFGLWLTTSFTTDYDEQTVTKFIEGMEERDIPLHVFHFDCYWMKAFEWCNFQWDSEIFPDPVEMLARYKARGLKISVWINSYIAQKSPLFAEGAKAGYFLKRTDGSVFQTDYWQPGMAYIDFTNPEAVKWFKDKLKVLLDMGVDSFKTDFGERIPTDDVMYYNGADPKKMHNYYTHMYNQAVFELIENEKGKNEAVLFARSATAGGQMYPVHWGGDCGATYPAMAETLRGGLSLACCGFGFWSHDIGGFENTASSDLYKRWCAFGLLSSHSRLHGSKTYRVPWLFDQEATEVLRYFVKLKCRLMPYLYGMAVKVHKEGIPMIRPMFMAFPGDRTCETLDKQYMLGDSLLVAPIFKTAGQVEYYLPEGKWVNYLTGEVAAGGCWRKEVHDYFSIPLWVKENTIIVHSYDETSPEFNLKMGFEVSVGSWSEGLSKSFELYDVEGVLAHTIHVHCRDHELEVSVDEAIDKWSVCVLGKDKKDISIKKIYLS